MEKWGRRRCRRPFSLPATPPCRGPPSPPPPLLHPGLDPGSRETACGIAVRTGRGRSRRRRDVDARNKSGHDGRTEETPRVSRPPMWRTPSCMRPPSPPTRPSPGAGRRRRGSATRIAATCRPADRICRPPGAARARSAFADGNVDRPVESANVDIPARHPRDANVESTAICLPDACVDGERAPPRAWGRPRCGPLFGHWREMRAGPVQPSGAGPAVGVPGRAGPRPHPPHEPRAVEGRNVGSIARGNDHRARFRGTRGRLYRLFPDPIYPQSSTRANA